jgi:hypothetical protein
MRDIFDQSTEMMLKSWKLWEQMIEGSPWMQTPEAPFSVKWSTWIATIRSTYHFNVNAWMYFVERSEETFFRLFKKSRNYNATVEEQMREIWEGLRKAHEVYGGTVRDQLRKMESLLREYE